MWPITWKVGGAECGAVWGRRRGGGFPSVPQDVRVVLWAGGHDLPGGEANDLPLWPQLC